MHTRPPVDPARAIVDAIQTLMAARLGRAFVPLVILFLVGIGGLFVNAPGGALTALGAVATVGATLAYGLRIVQRAVGRTDSLWMSAAYVGSLLPPAYGLYVVGWVGLRAIALGTSPAGLALAIGQMVLGVWVLRSWMKVVELERRARIMLRGAEGEGGDRWR